MIMSMFHVVELVQVTLQTWAMARSEGGLDANASLRLCLLSGVQWTAGVSVACYERLFGKVRLVLNIHGCHALHLLHAHAWRLH